MLVCCWPFSRTIHLREFANFIHVLPKPINHIQGRFRCRTFSYIIKMDGTKDKQHAVDMQKKRKTMAPIWRPVSTKSSSDNGVRVERLHHITSKDLSNAGNFSKNAEPSSEESFSLTQHVSCSEYITEALEENVCELSINVMEQKLSQSKRGACSLQSGGTVHEEKLEGKKVQGVGTDVDVNLVDVAEYHSKSIEVDASLIRFIKGKGGSTQQQIEGETGVKLIFPSSKKETFIVIEGASIKDITKASEKIQVVLAEAIKSPSLDYSHFISLPLATHSGLVEKLIDFQNSILGNPYSSQEKNLDSDTNEDTSDEAEDKGNQLGGENVSVKLNVQENTEHVKVEIGNEVGKKGSSEAPRSAVLSDLGIDKSIFIKPKTFHLTVLMLKLWNKERVAAAAEVLQRISPKVNDALDGRPISVRLKGLECMKGSLAKARVLYAPIEEIGGEDRVLRACQVIVDAYVEAGLVLERDAHQKLKLHATVMNARHRKSFD